MSPALPKVDRKSVEIILDESNNCISALFIITSRQINKTGSNFLIEMHYFGRLKFLKGGQNASQLSNFVLPF